MIHGKVYATLLALLENPGEIVTRELLQGRLWPGKTGIDRGFQSGLDDQQTAETPPGYRPRAPSRSRRLSARDMSSRQKSNTHINP